MPHTPFTNTLTRGTPGPRLPPERRAAPASTRRPAPPQDPTPRTIEEGPRPPAPRAARAWRRRAGGIAGGGVQGAAGGAPAAAPGAPVVHVVHTVSVSLCRQRLASAPRRPPRRAASPPLQCQSVTASATSF